MIQRKTQISCIALTAVALGFSLASQPMDCDWETVSQSSSEKSFDAREALEWEKIKHIDEQYLQLLAIRIIYGLYGREEIIISDAQKQLDEDIEKFLKVKPSSEELASLRHKMRFGSVNGHDFIWGNSSTYRGFCNRLAEELPALLSQNGINCFKEGKIKVCGETLGWVINPTVDCLPLEVKFWHESKDPLLTKVAEVTLEEKSYENFKKFKEFFSINETFHRALSLSQRKNKQGHSLYWVLKTFLLIKGNPLIWDIPFLQKENELLSYPLAIAFQRAVLMELCITDYDNVKLDSLFARPIESLDVDQRLPMQVLNIISPAVKLALMLLRVVISLPGENKGYNPELF
jgi:hypothetical protein